MSSNAMIRDKTGPYRPKSEGNMGGHTHTHTHTHSRTNHITRMETGKKREKNTQIRAQVYVEISTQIPTRGVTHVHIKAHHVHASGGVQRYTSRDIQFLTHAKTHTHTHTHTHTV